MLTFKGCHYPEAVVLYAVYFYVRYSVSYRDLEEIMAERGVTLDHATLNRWVIKYSRALAQVAKKRKRPGNPSWRTDETYIEVKRQWIYLYRAIDKYGDTLDFMLSERRDEEAATHFFLRTVGSNGLPKKVVIDKSGANYAGLLKLNLFLLWLGWHYLVEIRQIKYLNNIVEQDHRFIKRITRPMLGFKVFHSAEATLAGIETAHMIRKGQLNRQGLSGFQQFASLAG
ncbi:IS6 family transposase [Nitrosomonas sp. PY1]|uniref:IS6 family transposase n=1 Tax=Nitrosomonas sp. PY1 TaxID=1803906 RepID=UPI001FC8E657|nr:IS6 family transposase [Nitrosomonas sp. PY1]GKS68561.1 IS6 family transposase [Nitrosomonas sp. PY1]